MMCRCRHTFPDPLRVRVRTSLEGNRVPLVASVRWPVGGALFAARSGGLRAAGTLHCLLSTAMVGIDHHAMSDDSTVRSAAYFALTPNDISKKKRN